MSDGNNSHLSTQQIQQIRKQLRGRDVDHQSLGARIGRIISYPTKPQGNVRRYRFGMALLLFSVFLIGLALLIRDADWRWIFVGFAFATVLVAGWQIDLAKDR